MRGPSPRYCGARPCNFELTDAVRGAQSHRLTRHCVSDVVRSRETVYTSARRHIQRRLDSTYQVDRKTPTTGQHAFPDSRRVSTQQTTRVWNVSLGTERRICRIVTARRVTGDLRTIQSSLVPKSQFTHYLDIMDRLTTD